MAEDVIVLLGSVISTAFIVMSILLLSRYRKLTSSANESSRLVRDLWEALQERLKRQDERIIDLMAKVELYGVQSGKEKRRVETKKTIRGQASIAEAEEMVEPTGPLVRVTAGGTESKLLRVLLEGPKTSVDINRLIGKSREHTARLLKLLFQGGMVERDEKNKPFVYRLTEKGRHHLESGVG